jgi:hypothetical protein
MATSANTLATTAQTLMDQFNGGNITLNSYRNSMNSVIASYTGNDDFLNEDNADAAHTINLAVRLTQGEPPPVLRTR